jgi:hypothetical protein
MFFPLFPVEPPATILVRKGVIKWNDVKAVDGMTLIMVGFALTARARPTHIIPKRLLTNRNKCL